MPLVTKCPHCQKPAQVPDGYAGRQVRCPSCNQIFLAKAAIPRERVAPAQQPARSSSNGGEPNYRTAPVAVESRGTAAFSEIRNREPVPAAAICPSCKSRLPPGMAVCPNCGWLRVEAENLGESEVPPLLCINPACGVANPPSERYCQRCNTMLPSAPGTVLHGRYRLERLLAIGGFGAVYLASDVKANRPVAIKDMICTDPQEFNIRLGFFHREANILQALESVPIVPRFYDFIQQGQTAHLILEYIRGQDLLKIMETNGNQPFPLERVVEWGKSICDVLEHLHTQNPPIVHRDLKPDNIMLLEDGRTIRLIDFGTARDMDGRPPRKGQTRTRVFTEGYAPPEQIVGKPEVRSDLFALAGTLYHLATGKAPEGFYTARELDSQLSELRGPIPADQRWFFELLKINLSEDPNDRYFSAQEVKADLEQRRVTRELRCADCGHMNRVREPYCGRCAHPLTQPMPPCHFCGQANRMGSRCCIYCGSRLR